MVEKGLLAWAGISVMEGGSFLQKEGFLSRIFNDEQVEKGREEHSLKQELYNRLLNQHLLND